MTIALMLVTDGRRECLKRTVASLWEMWRGPDPATVVVVDDSGDLDAAIRFHADFPKWRGVIMIAHAERQGFAAAIASGWRCLRGVVKPDWVFHLEDDFVFTRPFSVPDMIAVLQARPYLVQMSLLRQPCNAVERAAGGLVQAHPGAFVQCADGDLRWMEQRLYFTTNPSVYRGELVERGWPRTERSEGKLTHQLLDHGLLVDEVKVPPDAVRFGVWGCTTDAPWVEHIGERVGTGY